MIIGIDIGGSTTDIVGFHNGKMIDNFTVRASDPIASAYGALGKFLNLNKLSISSIKQIAVTGAGSSFIDSNLMGIPTTKVDEFVAIGLGGIYLSELDQAIVVSMGTGTAIVKAVGRKITHLGGTGVGGGTLMGLSKCILNTTEFNSIVEMAKEGSLENVDLTIGDISNSNIGHLPNDITVSNFGKSNDKATKNDYAIGILNLIFQTVGMLSVLASKIENDKDIVLTGKVSRIKLGEEIFEKLSNLFNLNFHFPELGDYSTAIGAAKFLVDNK